MSQLGKINRDPRDILLAPVVSEKSYGLLDEGKYTFVVDPDANKTEIRDAVEKVFNVKVASVNTINRQGKRRRTRFGIGKRKDTKRAIVTLKDGTIDIFGGRRLTASGTARANRSRTNSPWASASTSRRRRAGAARPSPTSSRSPGRPRRSRWSVRCTKTGGRTTPAGSRRATRAAGTSGPTG